MKKVFKKIWEFIKYCGAVFVSGLMTAGLGILEIAFFPIWAIFIMVTPKDQNK